MTLRLLTRLSVAHFGQHRARVVLTCFGIALGVAAVAAVMALSRSIVTTFQTSVVRGAGAAQLQVSNGTAGLDRELVYAIAEEAGVTATGATVQHHLSVPALGRRLTVFGVELGRDEAYREAQTGSDVADIPDAITFIANTDSIAVSQELMTEQGWRPGTSIDVVGAHGAQRLTIRGVVHPKGTLGVYGSGIAIMDLDAAQKHFGEGDRVHWIDVVVAPDAATTTVQASIERILAGRGTVASPLARGRRIESMLSLLRVLLTATSILATFVGVFLIHHTLSTSYRQRREDFVRLRALGLSRWGLVGYLLLEAAALGLFASIIGIAAGVTLWLIATKDFSETISSLFVPMPTAQLALTTGEVVACLALGVVAVVAGALTPIAPMLRRRALAADEAAPTTPYAAAWLGVPGLLLLAVSVVLASQVQGRGFSAQVGLIGAMGASVFVGATFLVAPLLACAGPLLRGRAESVWAILGRWTLHQVWQQRLHTATTIGALSASVALAVAFTVLLGSYRNAFHSWFDQTFVTGDVIINAGPTLSLLGAQTIGPELGAAIQREDGVAEVLNWRFLEVEYRGRPIVIQAMSENLLERIYPDLARLDGVIISDTLAEHFGLSIGDTLALPAPVRELRAPISGIVPDYVLHLGTVKLPWKVFVDHFGDDSVSLLIVNTKAGTSPLEMKERIDRLVGERFDIAVLTTGDVRHLVEHLVDQSVALTYWLQVVAALVAVAAMVNATSASIMDRASELRTWRVLGLLRRRLVRLLVGEAAAVALLGSVLGLLAGLLLGFLMTTDIARAVAGYRLPIVWPIATFVGVPLLSTLAAAGAAAVVSLRWTRGRALTNASTAVQ